MIGVDVDNHMVCFEHSSSSTSEVENMKKMNFESWGLHGGSCPRIHAPLRHASISERTASDCLGETRWLCTPLHVHLCVLKLVLSVIQDVRHAINFPDQF